MDTNKQTFSIRRLWMILFVSMVVMFSIMALLGAEIYRLAQPMTEAVNCVSEETLYTRDDIETGQNVWQSIGGMGAGCDGG